MTEQQISIVVFIKAKQETKQRVKDQLLHMVEMTNKEEGNVNYDLHVSSSDDSMFIIYENWKDQAALDYHMNQSYLKDFLSKENEQLEKPIDGTICNIIK